MMQRLLARKGFALVQIRCSILDCREFPANAHPIPGLMLPIRDLHPDPPNLDV